MPSDPATPPALDALRRRVYAVLRRRDANDEGGRRAPGPEGAPLVGVRPAFRRDLLGTQVRYFHEYGDIVRLPLGPFTSYLLAHPDWIRHVLVDNQKNYTKGRLAEKLKPVLGEGLVTSDGELWRRQRRIAQPAFHRQKIQGFARIMVERTAALLAEWSALAASGKPVRLLGEMNRLTSSIAGLTLLGADAGGRTTAFSDAIAVAFRYVTDEGSRLLPIPAWVPTPARRRYDAALATLDGIVRAVIEERRRASEHPSDLLSMLMVARDEETGEAMSDAQLRDEVLTAYVAGQETSAAGLAWTFYLLSRHPAVARRVLEEVDAVLGDRAPALEDLPRLAYTSQVIDESMRLYPPVWRVTREAIADDEIGGYHIPAGSVVVCSQWLTHRNPAVWENPEGFDPDRFEPSRAKARPTHAYFPFGAGPRKCVGAVFATIEMQLILAMIVRAFRIDLVPGHALALDPSITLTPRDGLLVTLHARAPRDR